MDILANLGVGLGGVLGSPELLLAALVGCLLGTIVGVLPGLGPSTTMALLLPLALTLDPALSLIAMLGIYLGAMYGGTLAAVLLNVPGEPSAVMTALDGYQMARKGRAGAALAIAAIGSFIGGTISVLLLAGLAPPLAALALQFGPAEYFAVLVLALVLCATLVGRSFLVGFLALGLGLMLATVGTDLQTGVPKFTFGQSALLDGIDLEIPIIGIFGVAEVLWLLSQPEDSQARAVKIVGKIWPSRDELKASRGPFVRASGVGFVAGLLPGSGSTMGSFMAYIFEKRLAKKPDRFGNGAVEGVAAAETANNASTGGALAPMLTLGIPGSGATAVLLAYLIMYGIQPGPAFFTRNADLAWLLIASLFVSNLILLVLNLPLVPIFVKLLDVPARVLLPGILILAVIGGYAASNSLFNASLVIAFGALGFFMRLLRMEPALLVIGLVLGQMLDQRLRQAMSLSDNDFLGVVFASPLSIAFILMAILIVALDTMRLRRRKVQGSPASVTLSS